MNRLVFPLCLLVCGATVNAETWKLLDDFENGWQSGWNERIFTKLPTEYRVVRKQNGQALMGQSQKSASGLWHMLDIQPVESGSISWNWEVEHSLSSNRDERRKQGDDYAARVFVVFEPHFFSWRTRSICYVWAGQEAVGSIYASPYASNVATIVLESGDSRAGQWITEKRDFVADYKNFFGEPPKTVSAVAIMIDTDNTGGEATAYFNNIFLSVP